MTVKEAIKYANNHVSFDNRNSKDREAVQTLINASSRSIPRKAKIEHRHPYCPTCGHDLVIELSYGGTMTLNYCNLCGQEIDNGEAKW